MYAPLQRENNLARAFCALSQLEVHGVDNSSRSEYYPISSSKTNTVDDKDLYSGLIRLHILHHACEGEIFGLDMIEELGRHGYKMSPGTMYPILHGLETKGYLQSSTFRSGKIFRRVYRATPLGRKAVKAAKQKVRELFGELIEGK